MTKSGGFIALLLIAAILLCTPCNSALESDVDYEDNETKSAQIAAVVIITVIVIFVIYCVTGADSQSHERR
jgi:heme/copper-type cytochrome/quinol oxidase subunit 2